jgi:hypothetical protein
MPRTPINYSKTYIYKLVCKDPNITDKYVGHTTDPITRKSNHKGNCNNPNNPKYNLYVYQFIRLNGGWNNFEMVIIECINCKDGNEARTNERRWFDELKATLNKQLPLRNQNDIIERNKQYYEQNKDVINEYSKQYREQNKDVINEKNKQYYEQNKNTLNEKHKQYYEQNKDVINEKKKQYYEQHKEELNQKRREQRALKKIQSTEV